MSGRPREELVADSASDDRLGTVGEQKANNLAFQQSWVARFFRPTFKEIIFIFYRTFTEINNLTTSSEGSMEANLKNSLLGDK